jgi:hypothetical protein
MKDLKPTVQDLLLEDRRKKKHREVPRNMSDPFTLWSADTPWM